ncbi:MAG TPA: hypothetical protein VH591_22440 [Ktedonobacterales bacterium]
MSAQPRNPLVESDPRDTFPPRPDIPRRSRARFDRTISRIRRISPRLVTLAIVVTLQCILLLIALAPPSIWADLGMPNGPIPTELAPVVAGLFYVLPSVTGMLARRWQVAIILATLPAWLDLGIFAIAAASRIGPYYLALEPHAVSTVGTLELFAALGALGWLARPVVIGAYTRLRRAVAR